MEKKMIETSGPAQTYALGREMGERARPVRFSAWTAT